MAARRSATASPRTGSSPSSTPTAARAEIAASRVDGYKAHVLSDHDTELVLAVDATPANDPDGPLAAPMVAAARGLGVAVAEVLGDTAYGDGDTRQAVDQAGAKSSSIVKSFAMFTSAQSNH